MPDSTVQGSAATRERPGVWFIDVCKTCGRIAHWPFCEHRPEHFPLTLDAPRWYETVRVRETSRA